MELDPEEWLQIELRAKGCNEPRTTALLERTLRPGDTYVDVGAHVGYHSLVARRLVGDNGRIYSIDPQPYNCAKILTNAELNGFANIVVIAAAVGDSAGFASLKNQSRRDKARLTLAGSGINDVTVTFVVPKITLKWLLNTYKLQRVDFLKIDVEGYELEVLQGAGEALGAVGNMLLEVLPERDLEKNRILERMLRLCGFRLFDLAGAPWQPGRPCIENNVWARRP
jgi:FkbM family methyltransferase